MSAKKLKLKRDLQADLDFEEQRSVRLLEFSGVDHSSPEGGALRPVAGAVVGGNDAAPADLENGVSPPGARQHNTIAADSPLGGDPAPGGSPSASGTAKAGAANYGAAPASGE